MGGFRNVLKKTPLYSAYQVYKMGYEYPEFVRRLNRLDDEGIKAVIIGTVIHKNVGDHLICYSERKFLERCGIKSENIIEIPIELYKAYKNRIGKNIKKDIDIYISGGGWMGDVWPYDEKLIQDIVLRFKSHRKLIFPQSIYFKSKSSDFFVQSAKTYNGSKNLTMCLRDMMSYKIALENYKQVSEILLLPDISLSLREEDLEEIRGEKHIERKYLGVCERHDREKPNNSYLSDAVEYIKKSGIEVCNVSTISDTRVNESKREFTIKKVFKSYLSCKMIVTNRLHSMIISYLTETPCIFFDNSTGKVFGTYDQWLKNCHYLLYMDEYSEKDIKAFMDSWCGSRIGEKNKVNHDFSALERYVVDG